MIPIWRRRELRITYSLEEQFRMREILRAAGIEYIIRSDRHATRGGHGSTAFLNMDAAIAYRVYVDKSDYDRALRAITSI